MRFLIVALLVLNIQAVQAFEFSKYYCGVEKVESETEWDMSIGGIGWAEYMTELGWNESTPMNISTVKFYSNDGKTFIAELGFCGSISSYGPDYLRFTMYYVDGKNLDMLDGCIFTGDSVQYTKHTKDLVSHQDILVATHKLKIGDINYEFLNIIGVRADLVTDPMALCEKNFKDLGVSFRSVSENYNPHLRWFRK